MEVEEKSTAEMKTGHPKSDKMIKFEGKGEKWFCKKCLKPKFSEKHKEDCSKCTLLKKDEVRLDLTHNNIFKF